MNKLLSIIIPVYNVEKYIERCLDSIITSESQNYEVILIDDGSTDKSLEICQKYEKKFKNIFVFSKKNGGASDARNFGNTKARGEYIWYIDSDDYITPNAVNEILDIIKKFKSDVIICKSKKIYDNGTVMDECQYSIKKGEFSSNEFMNELRKNPKSVIFCPQYYIVNKNFIDNNNLYFYKGIIYEDELWIPQLLIKAKRIYYSDLNIYFHFMRSESVMHSTKLEKMRI